jgi:hypothetical protein
MFIVLTCRIQDLWTPLPELAPCVLTLNSTDLRRAIPDLSTGWQFTLAFALAFPKPESRSFHPRFAFDVRGSGLVRFGYCILLSSVIRIAEFLRAS